MIEFIAQNMAPIMFASLIIFLLIGYPVAFSLAANGLLFFFIGVLLSPYSGGSINLAWPLLHALPDNFYGTRVMSNDTLLAIPFFTFMGIVLERSGMAEDLLDTVGQLFGPIRGGLAYAVIFVGALLAATTGVVAASVIAMGLISLPIMLRYGYDRRLASGVIAASGTLAQIIPPSLVLIVLADQLGRSVGDMYAGALIPGLVLTGIYMLYILIMSIVRPNSMPALPLEARTLGHGVISLMVALLVTGAISYAAYRYLAPTHGDNADILGATVGVIVIYIVAIADQRLHINMMSKLAQQVVIVLIPPLALIFLVLGTIFLGIATPTEGGAMGAVGALIMAGFKGRLTMDVIKQALASTTRLSAFVLFILIGARVFSLTFYGVNGHIWVEHLLTSLPGGETGFLIGVNVLVFVLAFFLDFFELAFIIVPLLAPAADKLGIDLIWFGVLLGVNMQTSFMHPPFGFALFYLRSVAARVPYLDRITGKQIAPVTTGQIYWGAVPFVCIQVIMIGLTIAFPQMVMRYKGTAVEPSTIDLKLPDMPGLAPLGTPPGDNGAAPASGGSAPAAPGTPDLSQPPNFGDTAPAKPATPAPDLSKPPSFN
ncbi:TRAP transporter large permease subunit [Mesorhizobium sp. P16.1]|uniref:TRAP transporter large permease n=4 Tax=Mesorhizobium TaxID=68287 RepID=UPI0008007390|nr:MULTISPECIES: TRAP transporter large permease subunit [unclassified Mesorhizobium]MCT2576386.1 TRAP transporter large permease subunit [Mesorhizobium sp. P13.3]MDF3164682.1 TRAP transporter large permease subunit [Mesorhizobium sp. P16.1]MDF3180784.1 TRAP transporter large permease subunit [Mesorhizobium sp. P17.1]MDF3181593.1 TRAP transporter large permease subunit [Mesorhizobium sp. ICCV3110.1]OBQ94956.1 C4-dicarboxylate ABC transporter [Mesorhizobium sp. AA23]